MEVKKCCFIGHRKISITEELIKKVADYIEYLITKESAGSFIFGDFSQFSEMCYEIVTHLKEKYIDISRVYYRIGHQEIDDSAEKFLLKYFEQVVFPKECINAGKTMYIKRNEAMIKDSDYCLFYYDKNYLPPRRFHSKRSVNSYQPNSGTAIAYKYAKQKGKITYNFK